MAKLHPPIEPYDHGLLDTGDGNRISWEVCGNPDGKPALVVHGGPGSGRSTSARRVFDPARYRIVQLDQRGCGGSRPHASAPTTDLTSNTTAHLIDDMEQLRAHLGIERWLLHGGSWGATLILAYAERHPHRVSEIVLAGVTTTRRAEIDWLYRGVARFFPAAWDRFRAGAPEAADDGDLVAAYARRMAHADPAVRGAAANAWCAWEDAVLSLEPGGADVYGGRAPDDRLAFVRICTHYFAHGAWLEDGALLRDAGRLAGIPGVLLHGRLDLAAPLATAWELARAWPDARLIVVDDAGHTGSATMRDHLVDALEAFARGATPARPARGDTRDRTAR